MNPKSTMIALVCVATISFAQNNSKFRLYGFADLSLTKIFLQDGAMMMSDQDDGNLHFNLSHLNLYQEFRPNDRLRFLSELSFQSRPVTFASTSGTKSADGTITTEASGMPSNTYTKGVEIYDYGSVSVERAIMSVKFHRLFNLSFGQFITPAGIWTVDHGSPVIVTSSQPTMYSFIQIYPKSQLGMLGEGTTFLGNADLNYALYVSSGRENPTIYKACDLAGGGQVRLGLPLLDEFRIGVAGYSGKLKSVSLYSVSTGMGPGGEMQEVVNYDYRETVLGADLRLRKSIFALMGEFNFQNIDDRIDDNDIKGALGGFGLFSADVFKKDNFIVTPYAFFESIKFLNLNPGDAIRSNTVTESTTSESESATEQQGMPEGIDGLPMEGMEGLPQAGGPSGGGGGGKYYKLMVGINTRIFTNFGIKIEFDYTKHMPKGQEGWGVPGFSTQFYIAF